jgi:hypothetical protein
MPVMTRVERSRRHSPVDLRGAKRRLSSTPDQLILGAAGLADYRAALIGMPSPGAISPAPEGTT